MVPTILISLGLAAVVGLIIRKMILDKKRGKSGCSCGCGGCAMSDVCHPEEKKQ